MDILTSIIDFLKNNMYVVFVFVAFIVVSIAYSIIRMGALKKGGQNFLSQHPNAAKVMLTSKGVVASEAVEVYSVNGQAPAKFADGTKMGFYLVPGRSTVEISYSHNRPGVMYKNVTTTTGAVQKELEVEANKTYQLGFDRKAEEFTFEEI